MLLFGLEMTEMQVLIMKKGIICDICSMVLLSGIILSLWDFYGG